MACDDVGRAWQGRGGGRTCPISAPLPDLMLVLPFSSPCSLQTPSFSLSQPRSTVGWRLSEPLLQGTSKGTSRSPGLPRGAHPPCPENPLPKIGDRAGAETLQPLVTQVRNSTLGEGRKSRERRGLLSPHPR